MADGPNGGGRSSYGGTSEDSLVPRQLEAFSRKVTATASQLMGPLEGATSLNHHYHDALGSLHREMRRPMIQRSMFSFAQNSPKELIRNVQTSEISHRALSYLPDELLRNIPETTGSYSLFEGFQASLPEDFEALKRKRIKGRGAGRGRKAIKGADADLDDEDGPEELKELNNEKFTLGHRLEMLGVRKNMCASEIREIDQKISNLNTMRRMVLERLASLEQDEIELEQEIVGVDTRLEDLREELEDKAALAGKSPKIGIEKNEIDEDGREGGDFMSESIYEKIPSPRSKRRPAGIKSRRISMPILHEHLNPGSKIREIQAHNDTITALDFDYPFGTMVTAALDDTVRVWDLNAGRCIGMLEGHLSSVRCLQVEDEIVATGSMDATIRLWDLSRAEYAPKDSSHISRGRRPAEPSDAEDADIEDDGLAFQNDGEEIPAPRPDSMANCPLFTLQAHVAEVTALHFRGTTLVTGSADKTLRQWDLEKGRCVQTLDVLWAAAQASAAPLHSGNSSWKELGMMGVGGARVPDPEADFVGALQCFDAALACGTADGMVRLWDLRSGQVHRSLVGHTGPISALQFDDTHLVTASLDRSVRIWDLRTGTIHDAFAHSLPITDMQFDTRRIVAAAGEPVVKIYDKADGRHWNLGAGMLEEMEGPVGIIERVRVKEGYCVEGRRDGVVGVWSC